VYDLNV